MDKREAERKLAELFRRRGYVRVPDAERRNEEDSQSYRKGWEVRLVIDTTTAARDTRRMLKDAGFEPGNLFGKHARWVVPVYGREAVERFLKWSDPPMTVAQRARRKKAPQRRPAAPAKQPVARRGR